MNTENTDFFIECIDHTVTKESFKLFLDSHYDMLITTPKPSNDNLSKYYQSEDYVSHTDSRRTLVEKLYHLVKNYSIRKKVRLISKYNKQVGTILDIGAGTGDFLKSARNKKWKAVGVEPNDDARKLAKEKEVELFINTNMIKTGNFDIITMWHVLEHVSDLQNQIQEIKRLLKPKGYLIVAVPNFKSYDAKYYDRYWAAYDVPRHLWHFSKKSIDTLFFEHNIKLKKVLPMKFDSYYVSLLSEKYKNGKTNYFKAFLVGLYSNISALFTKEYSSHIYILKNEQKLD